VHRFLNKKVCHYLRTTLPISNGLLYFMSGATTLLVHTIQEHYIVAAHSIKHRIRNKQVVGPSLGRVPLRSNIGQVIYTCVLLHSVENHCHTISAARKIRPNQKWQRQPGRPRATRLRTLQKDLALLNWPGEVLRTASRGATS